jgi:hypothetical protein
MPENEECRIISHLSIRIYTKNSADHPIALGYSRMARTKAQIIAVFPLGSMLDLRRSQLPQRHCKPQGGILNTAWLCRFS